MQPVRVCAAVAPSQRCSHVLRQCIEVGNLTPENGCKTLGVSLLGKHGYHDNLHVDLIQQYGVTERVAKHLANVRATAAGALVAAVGGSHVTRARVCTPRRSHRHTVAAPTTYSAMHGRLGFGSPRSASLW